MKPFTTIAIAVFSIVALLQLLRIVMGWEVVIDGLQIPVWASVIALAVAAGLAIMVWREHRS